MFKKMCGGGKCGGTDAALLVLRLGVGGIFIVTGWMKVSDLAATVGVFGQMGLAPFWAYLVSFVELVGGVAVLLGIYARAAAGLLAITMLVASYKLLATPQMLIAPVSLLFSTIALTLGGSGKYSLLRGTCGCGCTLPCNCGNCSACQSTT